MHTRILRLFLSVLAHLTLVSVLFPIDLFASELCLNNEEERRISKIESLTEIADSDPTHTLYFFDIDDTLFDSAYMLGSKAWRKYIVAATKDDPTEDWHDIFSLFIARNHPLQAIETMTSEFIQELQTKSEAVFGLTARERKMWYDTPMADTDLLTIAQLESVGISFDHPSIDKTHPHLTSDSEYFKGVFFANIEPKGEYLLKLFKDAPQLPAKVIFVDDKQNQVESVAAALNQLGIDYECYWYTATDSKASKFNPLIANIQLYYFWISEGERVLSDNEAHSIAEQHPERDAEYYLQSLLNEAKAKRLKENHSNLIYPEGALHAKKNDPNLIDIRSLTSTG